MPRLSLTFIPGGSLGGRYQTPCALQALPLQALHQAIVCAEETTGLIHHSDHGSQYVSVVYNERLAQHGIAASTGAVGDSYDNALAENVNGSYKNELIHTRRWNDVVEVEIATFEWVSWWNETRLRSSPGKWCIWLSSMWLVSGSGPMAIGVDVEGIKHILGLWIAKEEGASLWAQVCSNLSNRGVKDVFIVCCDGLKGLAEAVEATWPGSMVQTCVVHLIRAANRWVAYGDRKPVSAALKKVYTAPDEAAAAAALEEFADSELGEKYPRSVKVWQDAWERFIPFLQFPPAARKVIYTTNSIESFNNELRKATRNRVQFTNDESALKTLWLMICNIEDKRAAKRAKQGKRATASASRLVEGGKVSGWKQAINQMAVAYPERFDQYL